ncbi:MAG: hypothetical protein ABR582_11205 [Gemmatimonadaceae bacterium]
MRFSRHVSLVFVATLFGCGDGKNAQQADTSSSSTSFTGAFGDSLGAHVYRPTAGVYDTAVAPPSPAGA